MTDLENVGGIIFDSSFETLQQNHIDRDCYEPCYSVEKGFLFIADLDSLLF